MVALQCTKCDGYQSKRVILLLFLFGIFVYQSKNVAKTVSVWKEVLLYRSVIEMSFWLFDNYLQ